ncbi:MAG TPA: hypothetical protein VGF12_00975 [Roseateles sp.]|uniref:hypothetical protein n=1 Tax=Roseateles sp. TaxID=1971397 RepID=UPI002EDB4BBA
MIRCSVCRRQLLATAVPGRCIGPKCARDLGLHVNSMPRARTFDLRHTDPNPAQLDWVTQFNAGHLAGERTTS